LNLPRFGGVFFAALAAMPEPLRPPVLHWFERAADEPAWRDFDANLPMRWLAELPRVLAASEFAAAALLQDPGALTWLWQREDGARSGDAEARAIAASTEAEAVFELRVWRRRELLRIAWREIVGRAGVAETLHDLSDFADAAIRVASDIAARLLSPVFGTPRSRSGASVPMIVLGMGKLGGRELNFSSDIDLILLFAEEGETDGARATANEEYFQRLGRSFIRLLDQRTDQGFVFRVDMRLRPFGESGPLVVSLAALEDYLQQHGRDWERYAWVKARAIVGADAYAATYRDGVKPFVYRRYLDFGVFESLRDMKAMIAREVARRELDQDLKLGKGGIREIEFIVQSFQLVRGGGDRRLQNPSLLDVLPILAGAKLLPRAAIDELREAYLLLRRAENLLQIIRDEQTHALPAGEVDRLRLAAGLRANLAEPYDWPAAATLLDAARESAAKAFEALVFGGPEGPLARADASLDWLAQDGAQLAVELAGIGFPDGEIAAVTAVLVSYRDAAPYGKLDEVGRRRLRVILDRLLRAAAGAAAPALVTARVLRILEAIGARSSYLALLKEQPAALARLIDVCAISGFLARQIAEFPLLLDELIDVNAFEELPSREGFARELAARTERLPSGDPERQVEALREFQKAAVFAVALADLTGRLPLMTVSDRLTDIAELIVQCCMDLAWEQITAIYGVPECGEPGAAPRVARVAVVGYGKLGGIELGYGSDLDLVFLHDSTGEIQQTRGNRTIDNGVFFLRLGQRIVHLLTMHSASGRLYEVDMRLRPNGKGGFLMTGIDSFERYQHDDAWTWEHQALLRARAVAGDARLCARFSNARLRALSVDVRRETLRVDVMEMRARMRRELSLSRDGRFDIKQDAGGLADIEFLVQYWVLAAAHRHPQVVTFTDNIRQLEALSHFGVISPDTAQWLMDAYRGYRAVLHRRSLEGGGLEGGGLEGGSERVVDAAAHAATRARIRAIWQETFGEPQ
jgi:glutamate-ammonia-ligase adenylyltransferase